LLCAYSWDLRTTKILPRVLLIVKASANATRLILKRPPLQAECLPPGSSRIAFRALMASVLELELTLSCRDFEITLTANPASAAAANQCVLSLSELKNKSVVGPQLKQIFIVSALAHWVVDGHHSKVGIPSMPEHKVGGERSSVLPATEKHNHAIKSRKAVCSMNIGKCC
jgi:hypothetical protein